MKNYQLIGFKTASINKIYTASDASKIAGLVDSLYFEPVYGSEKTGVLEGVFPPAVAAARVQAMVWHGDQRYGKDVDSPLYVYHLDRVVAELISVGGFDESITMVVALYFHDVIEDQDHVSYEDIETFCVDNHISYKLVEDVVFAMTDIVNPDTNKGIFNEYALFQSDRGWKGKLCDRMANCRQNIVEKGVIRSKYVEQQKRWVNSLYSINDSCDRPTFVLQSRLMELIGTASSLG